MDTKFIGKKSAAAGGWGALKSCGKQLLQSGMPISGAHHAEGEPAGWV